jgi:hypothetical protein
MRCEFSFGGVRCGKEATTKVLGYFVCKKHKRVWKQRITGSTLSPDGKQREAEKKEYGL